MIAARPTAAPAPATAVRIAGLCHRYGERQALRDIDLDVRRGEIFGVLGPNGGGKTTLFKVLSTLTPPQTGTVTIFDEDVRVVPERVRHRLGVVFQHAALDGKLTVLENLRCHAALYGLAAAEADARAASLLAELGVADRGGDAVDTLSGGLARRVELGKGLLHRPALLLLDEPSTGLDPGARRDFFDHLVQLRDRDGLTVVLTTHHMDEAERCDRVGFVHRGGLVAVDEPASLTAAIGGDVVTVEGVDPERLRPRLAQRFGVAPQLVGGALRIEVPRGHELVREIVDAFGGEVRTVSVGKPTLEDVFVHLTGERLSDDGTPR